MKILIVSDTHGNDDNLLRAINREKPIDKLIHLGDMQGLEDYIERLADVPCFMVKGNCDPYCTLPIDSVVMVGSHKAFITHGHYYEVDFGHDTLIRHALSLGCDIAMYGHTHFPLIEKERGVTVLNPGSLTRPRQPDRRASYIVAEIGENGEPSFALKYL